MHRIEDGFVVQGGDVTRGDGSGGESICKLDSIWLGKESWWIVDSCHRCHHSTEFAGRWRKLSGRERGTQIGLGEMLYWHGQ